MNAYKRILLVILLVSVSVFADTLTLNAGWNLIGTNSQATKDSILNSLGSDNVLIIQGPSKTYQKSYVDAGQGFLNDFTGFEEGKGYWIKLDSDATLEFTPLALSSTVTLPLTSGWNLIDPLTDLSLNDIITQLGSDNVLIIQGPSKTYQKSYVDAGQDFLNDFTGFEEGKGYWMKLDSDATLSFEPTSINLTIPAVTNTAAEVDYLTTIDSTSVNIKVFTDSNVTATSQSTISIFGSINTTPITSELKLSSNYVVGDSFQVVVYDTNSNILGRSDIVTYQGVPIDFGTITINENNNSTGIETPPEVPDINSTTTPPPVPTL